MGGLGSGRHRGSRRDTVNSCREIDINWLNRKGFLRPGANRSLSWSLDGEYVASAGIIAGSGWIELRYEVSIDGGDWESISESVDIVQVPCTLGGSRPYFLCPGFVDGIACRRRVAKLHGGGRYFACRHCYDLAYSSRSEPFWDRLVRKSEKLRRRLGSDSGLGDRLPVRPKGMWRRTYDRICADIHQVEGQAQMSILTRLTPRNTFGVGEM
jgi:hypothetical protein